MAPSRAASPEGERSETVERGLAVLLGVIGVDSVLGRRDRGVLLLLGLQAHQLAACALAQVDSLAEVLDIRGLDVLNPLEHFRLDRRGRPSGASGS